MAAKAIKVSDDAGANWYTLPGSTRQFESAAEAINDTIFGNTFQSSEIGLITWGMSANAYFKGFAGYLARLKAPGTPTTTTGEATTLLSGKSYQIDATTKRIIDRSASIVVYDNAVDHTADVVSIDFLFGIVTFASTYTVTGPVTVDYTYIPTTDLGSGQSYTLTMQAAEVDNSTFATVQANSGHRTFEPGLRTVALEVGGVFNATVNSRAALVARDELIVEIDPVGDGSSIARGFFKYSNVQQSGDVGALEAETLNLELNTPEDDNFLIEQYFSWQHTATTLSTAVQKLLNAWLTESTTLLAEYLPQGAEGQSPLDGKKGSVIVTDVSLSGGLSDMNTFAASLRGSGAITEV